MMIATILLIMNFVSLIFNGAVLFNFWWFVLLYPLEVVLYILFYIFLIIVISVISVIGDK